MVFEDFFCLIVWIELIKVLVILVISMIIKFLFLFSYKIFGDIICLISVIVLNFKFLVFLKLYDFYLIY